MKIELEKSSPRQLYDLLLSAVVPRPIAWVSTRGKSGIDNLAPYSFFNLFSANPPILGFSPGLKRQPGSSEAVMKDTLRNVIETEEFVVNIVSAELAEIMVKSSANYAAEQSEFAATGLSAVKSCKVAAARVGESHVSMECKLFQVVDLGSNKLVLGQIICMHVDDALLVDGSIDPAKLKPVARLGGELYCVVEDTFAIQRPNL